MDGGLGLSVSLFQDCFVLLDVISAVDFFAVWIKGLIMQGLTNFLPNCLGQRKNTPSIALLNIIACWAGTHLLHTRVHRL